VRWKKAKNVEFFNMWKHFQKMLNNMFHENVDQKILITNVGGATVDSTFCLKNVVTFFN
jgi:hypothetical protein